MSDRSSRSDTGGRTISLWRRFMARPEATSIAGTVLVFAIFWLAAGDSDQTFSSMPLHVEVR